MGAVRWLIFLLFMCIIAALWGQCALAYLQLMDIPNIKKSLVDHLEIKNNTIQYTEGIRYDKFLTHEMYLVNWCLSLNAIAVTTYCLLIMYKIITRDEGDYLPYFVILECLNITLSAAFHGIMFLLLECESMCKRMYGDLETFRQACEIKCDNDNVASYRARDLAINTGIFDLGSFLLTACIFGYWRVIRKKVVVINLQ